VATFSGLTLSQAGQGYTVQATSGGLAPATTNGINVVAPQVSVANVSLQSVHTGKRKSHPVIVVQFSDGLSALAAENTGAYSLTTLAEGKKLKSRSVPLLQASYNAVAHTVSLTPGAKLVLSPPLQLRINTATLNGVVQASGSGDSGADVVATISKQGVSTISAAATPTPATTAPVSQLPAHAVDAVIKSGFRARPRHQ
jgi:hypothetical protein